MVSDEMEEIFSKKRNNASGVIITSKQTNNRVFLLQRKTKDYLVRDFAHTFCLFGGNSELEDQSPYDTLKRELSEELPEISKEILENSKIFSSFNVVVPLPDKRTYEYFSNIFVSEVAEEKMEEFLKNCCLEGTMELIYENDLNNEVNQFCWGYDFIFQEYLNTINSEVRIKCKEDIKCKKM
jgi:8-oxo-dGTP pyrophosphatase MutT (NUDIX family)